MNWESLLHNLAFPVVTTCALSVVVWKIANIFYTELYTPMQRKHMELVDKLEQSLERLCDSQQQVTELIQRVMSRLEDHEARLNRIEEKVH